MLPFWHRNINYFRMDNKGIKMNSKEVTSLITKAIAAELESANEKFAQFSSIHEGYAVLLEEVEEARADMESIEVYLKTLWSAVKRDYNKSCYKSAYDVKCAGVRAIHELIQVCAMCDKFCDMEEGKEQFYIDKEFSIFTIRQ